ncbi:rho GTPase-activating protein 7-like [Bidens hawaiensis]|uniref:rho GTPase-activating protein 7-like n=1 Tax=Bidens hawaiensis TaxID=980011 RepID=UPI0040493AE6
MMKLFPGKLKSKWTGPFVIVGVGNHGQFEIEDFDDHIRQVVNGYRLKPYLEMEDIHKMDKESSLFDFCLEFGAVNPKCGEAFGEVQVIEFCMSDVPGSSSGAARRKRQRPAGAGRRGPVARPRGVPDPPQPVVRQPRVIRACYDPVRIGGPRKAGICELHDPPTLVPVRQGPQAPPPPGTDAAVALQMGILTHRHPIYVPHNIKPQQQHPLRQPQQPQQPVTLESIHQQQMEMWAHMARQDEYFRILFTHLQVSIPASLQSHKSAGDQAEASGSGQAADQPDPAGVLVGDGDVCHECVESNEPNLALHCCDYQVFKTGPLFISSKGLGWKSWKKRWFILTRTSLVFFKNDPSALPQRESEVNLTLGGIDLNNSGSVVVRENKKLLAVLFPDGRDGRPFTLKTETCEDLYEWKTALEQALAQAPNAALVTGQNGIFWNATVDSDRGSFLQWRDKQPVKSFVVGRPILLALEDIDGAPSFLEKALRFLETHGSKVEGVLRQSADVEEVDRRVQEYEKGKDFSCDEDAHVVGDCVKHVLRQLPSSPVPASCCYALLEAYKIDQKEARVNAMRTAIFETFPEPNRRLFQRILKMMHTVSLKTSENRMTALAVAACMAPLLLPPLLAGECELDDDIDDNSAQLLAAANAASNAQAIIATLLEEFENVFDDNAMVRCSISAESRDISASEDSSDDETMDIENNVYHDAENEAGQESDDDDDDDDDPERIFSGKLSESSGYACSDLYDFKVCGADETDVASPRDNVYSAIISNSLEDSQPLEEDSNVVSNEQQVQQNRPSDNQMDVPQSLSGLESSTGTPVSLLTGSNISSRRSTIWGRNNGRKTPSVESFDSSGEEELAIQRLELTKNDLRQKLENEARGNMILQASLERRKRTLHERRVALEQDVSRLQEQLQAERDLRSVLEVGLNMSSGPVSRYHNMDPKMRAELEEIVIAEADVARLKQKVAELHQQLHQQRHCHYDYQHDYNYQQRVLQQHFDSTISYINHERKQRSEETSLGAELRNIKGQTLMNGNKSRQPTRVQFLDPTRLSDSKTTKTSTSFSIDEFGAFDYASLASTSGPTEVIDHSRNPLAASSSSTLVELTTRLDFFKERRSQLMEQLHNLDLSYATSSQNVAYKQPDRKIPKRS